MGSEVKTFKEYSDLMKRADYCIKAVCSRHGNYSVLIAALSSFDFFKKHPRLSYKEYLKSHAT